MNDELIYRFEEDSEIVGVAEPRTTHSNNEDPRLAALLDLLNQRWTASILRSLKAGQSRFNMISREHGINPNTLKARLRDLEHEMLVSREVVSHMPPKVNYSLTEKGRELAEIFERLHQWAEVHATEPMDFVAESGPEKTYSAE
jgi:DNA-binding HxlR family transcriptional regulator